MISTHKYTTSYNSRNERLCWQDYKMCTVDLSTTTNGRASSKVRIQSTDYNNK